jgi:predicted O-linked N-acetylglucosamine transferase (SPINDLY family)
MTSRNAPCPCGSGRKYKHCHGSAGAQKLASTAEQFSQAGALFRAGKVDQALALARKLPHTPQRSRFLLGILISRREPADIELALAVIAKWRQQEPANPEPLKRLLEISLFQGDLEQAKRARNGLEERVPGHASLPYYLGVISQLEGKLDTAHEAYTRAVGMSGEFAGDGSQGAEKAQAVRAALQMCETAIGNYAGSGGQDQQRLLDCPAEIEVLRTCLLDWENCNRAEGREPPGEEVTLASNAWYNLGCSLMSDYGRNAQCIECFKRAVEINPDHELARLNILFALNYATDIDESEIFGEHQRTGAWLASRHAAEPPPAGWTASQHRPLRIGYLSSDFHEHSVAHFTLPVIEHHDPEQFTVFLYHNGSKTDGYTRRARAGAHRYQQVRALDDDRLRQVILQDRIDILVDLNGLTENNRIALFAARAAPLQIAWIGYPNTTGLSTVDYRIVDRITDPEAYAQSLNTEKLVYLPGVFSVYDPPASLPQVMPAPSLESGFVTFGSFNNLPKLNDSLIESWVRIMNRVPGSRLLIKNLPLSYAEPRRRLLKAFSDHGLNTNRLELAGKTREKSEHMAYYHRVDISLDSYPYSGTTTTCDSLMMGVPVVTQAGRAHRSRVSASQLSALGLQSLVTEGREGYVETAVALALDQARLLSLRDGLRERVLDSCLTEAASFTRGVEALYGSLWAHRCEGGARE